MIKTGISLIGANTIVGTLPSSGTEGETKLKTNFATGVGHVGKAFPVMGKVKGTKMVLKSVKKLTKIGRGYKL